ncbi:MAG: methyltransferase [Alcanivoracaceae bacterium]
MHSAVDFDDLDRLLAAHRHWWQPAPFRHAEIPWLQNHGRAGQALLALSDDDYQSLRTDDSAARRFLCALFPDLRELDRFPEPDAPDLPAGFTEPTHMAGRKAAQVACFCNALESPTGHLVEWCAGQGWLLEQALKQFPAHTGIGLERTLRLCQQGNARMRKRGLSGLLLEADVMDESTLPALDGNDTVLALHACGHLHQQLVQWAPHQQAGHILLSPCCYHLGERRALSRTAARGRLAADSIDPHLAVQDLTTGHSNRSKRQEKAVAWRLGYDSLRQHLCADTLYRPLRSMPGSVWQGDFADFCQLAAAHHGISLPRETDWPYWLSRGEKRRGEVRRLELLRRQYRRLLEWWLVLDAGYALAEQGYQVSVAPFCDPQYTPRNLLVSARRDRP